jgi:hypothetical protein
VKSFKNEGEHELIVGNNKLDPFDSEQQFLIAMEAGV